MNSEDIATCPIHGLKFNKKEYKMCYKCYFKKCNVCNKHLIKSDSEYLTCYDCYVKKKKDKEGDDNVDNKIKNKKKKNNSIFN